MTEKILVDTDIGSDIDDAVALAYLLMQPEAEILGITTVSGQSELRAQMADVICQAAGRDIPIVPGVENPLIVENRQSLAPWLSIIMVGTPEFVRLSYSQPRPVTITSESNNDVSRCETILSITVSAPPGPVVSIRCRTLIFSLLTDDLVS